MPNSQHPRPRALLIVVVLLAAWATNCRHEPTWCASCGRGECKNMTLVVRRADGTRQHACCARCGARIVARDRRPVSSITVRDFETADPIDAERATLVEGSDVHPCLGVVSNPPRDDRGCCLKAVYDRCEPSVLAFGSTDAAARFMRDHGGTRTTWAALLAGVEAGS